MAAALFVAAATAAARGQDRSSAAAVPSITVEGSATREIMPDLALITLGVVTEQPTASEAVVKTNAAAAAMIAQVKAEGIAATDVRTAEVSLRPLPDSPNKGKARGFQASNHIDVKVRAISKVGEIVGRLIASGANELQSVDFVVDNPRGVLDSLRAEATRDARAKAQIYTDAAGVKLGRILQIVPDSAAPSRVYRAMKAQTAMASDVSIPMSPAMQMLESRVSVTWELLP